MTDSESSFLEFRLPAVCILPFTFTLVRDFQSLDTDLFRPAVGLSQADAARGSALFPLFGGLSVLPSGFASDRLKQGGRAAIIFYGLLFAGAVLFLLGHLNFHASRHLPVALVTLVGFLMIGPYSYLAGAI